MANQIQIGGIPTGTALVAVIHPASDGSQTWNKITAAFETTDYTNWINGQYYLPLTETPALSQSGYFVADFPSAITAGAYCLEFHSDVNTDFTDPYMGGGYIEWDGSAVLPLSGLPAAWGASVIGNGRTRDFFLQGGTNKVDFAADGLSFTVYSTDDTTTLFTGVATRLGATIGGLRSVDPT